jgi:hypothetical protein
MMSKRLAGNIAKLGAACAFSALIVASSQARADDTTSALLDLLKAKGDITQSEYDKIKARQQAEAKDSTQKVQAAEAKAREAEAKAKEAEAKANEAQAKAQSDSAEVAKAKAETLTAADMAIPTKMPAKSPVEYVTVLPNCVGIRVGEVDICTKGDLSFFGVEQFPDKNANPPSIGGGLAFADRNNSNAIRGGLLPSSLQLSLATHQMGMDIGVYVGIYTGGNNVAPNAVNANGPGSPISLGTPGIDFRQFFGTIGTPTWGTVKIGRDIGLFAQDAILNDLTLFGVGSPANNAAPGNTSLGRIGVGYIYADFIPQITYTSPTIGGFTVAFGAFTPYDQLDFSGSDTTSTLFTGHDAPRGEAKLSYVNAFSPDAKLTLSTSGVVQGQQTDCSTFGTNSAGFCFAGVPAFASPVLTNLTEGQNVTAWAVDGFAMLDLWGWNFVAYGYTGKGVGTTGQFFDGIDFFGEARKSDGGYLQAAYTFNHVFTLGGSYGISRLDTASSTDQFFVDEECFTGAFANCLVKSNASWIGFARYKLTKWVNLQAEYVATKSENQIGQTIHDNAVVAGTTFFW